MSRSKPSDAFNKKLKEMMSKKEKGSSNDNTNKRQLRKEDAQNFSTNQNVNSARQQPSERSILLLDFDDVIAGSDKNGGDKFVEMTLDKVRKLAKTHEPCIFTSMTIDNIRNDAKSDEEDSPTRLRGQEKIKAIYKEQGLPIPAVDIIVTEDALRQSKIGFTLQEHLLPIFHAMKKYKKNGQINLMEVLNNEKIYRDYKVEEFYFKYIDAMFQATLSGKNRIFNKNLAEGYLDDMRQLITTAIDFTGSHSVMKSPETRQLLINEIAKVQGVLVKIPHGEKDKANKATAEVMNGINGIITEESDSVFTEEIRQSIRNISEAIQNSENKLFKNANSLIHLMYTHQGSPADLKEAFSTFLNDHQKDPFVKGNKDLFDLVKDLQIAEPQKFAMALHTIVQLTKSAKNGDIINIEYCDDLESNLNAMIEAQRFYMENMCDKKLTINLKTTLVLGAKDDNTTHNDHREITLTSEYKATDKPHEKLLKYLGLGQRLYLKVESGKQSHSKDFDELTGKKWNFVNSDQNSMLRAVVKDIEKKLHKQINEYTDDFFSHILGKSKKDARSFGEHINKRIKTEESHYSRFLLLTLHQIYNQYTDILKPDTTIQQALETFKYDENMKMYHQKLPPLDFNLKDKKLEDKEGEGDSRSNKEEIHSFYNNH